MAKMATLVRLHTMAQCEPFSPAIAEIAAPVRPFRLRIGAFELDPKSGELTNAHSKVVLQWQPLQLLLLLIDCCGEMVSRAEIQDQLWGEDVIVDFDHSINQLVRKLRRALGDSAQSPSYIETVARRGYRLKVPVEAVEKPSANFRRANDGRSATGKLSGAWNRREASEPAASRASSALRLNESAGAAEQYQQGRRALSCRARGFRQSEQQPNRTMPVTRAIATQPLRQYLLSANTAERLETLRQLLVFVTQALDGEPM